MGTAARKAPAAAAVKMPDGLMMPLSASWVGLGEAIVVNGGIDGGGERQRD